MKIYRYWVRREEDLQLDCGIQKSVIYGSSNFSLEDAAENAKEKAAAIQERIRSGIRRTPDYEVSIREELLEEIIPGNVVTRNRYGAEVLNTETVIFADIDLTNLPKRSRPGLLLKLFGKKEETPAEFQTRLQDFVFGLIRPEWKENGTVRIYRTKAGYRILFAGLNIDTGSPECTKLLKALRSDPIYNLLCEKQRCCRARLTPKPFRIRMKGRRFSYPYAEEELQVCVEWVREYQEKSQGFSVCKFLKSFGKTPSEADQRIIDYHDSRCKADQDLPLA